MKYLSRSLAVITLAIPFVLLAFAQAEHHTTSAAARVSVGHGAPILERLVPANMVNVAARHCQRYMRGGKVDSLACASDPSTMFYTHTDHNLRTTAGGDAQASQMGNTATQAASCNYVALSNDSGAPSAADTSVASEIVSNGLSRAQGTYAHTTSTSAFTIQKVFSATGTQASQKTGLLNAASTGTLCFENTYTQVTVNNGDTLTVTWTINY